MTGLQIDGLCLIWIVYAWILSYAPSRGKGGQGEVTVAQGLYGKSLSLNYHPFPMAQPYACQCLNIRIEGQISENAPNERFLRVNVRDDDIHVVSIEIHSVRSRRLS